MDESGLAEDNDEYTFVDGVCLGLSIIFAAVAAYFWIGY